MDDMPVARLRFRAGARSNLGAYDARSNNPQFDDDRTEEEQDWVPKQLKDLLEDVSSAPPTLRERLENWGSD